MRGRLITLEGIDGSGKSTQARLLVAYLRRRLAGVEVLHTWEPGGTPLGRQIREILLHPTRRSEGSQGSQPRGGFSGPGREPVMGRQAGSDQGGLGDSAVPMAEALLMAADRAQHVEQVIRPAIEAGHLVVCERYVDSSVAYQGFGLELGAEPVLAVNRLATGGIEPDLTILFELEAGQRLTGTARVRDRIEGRDEGYFERVREGFRWTARAFPERCVVIRPAGRSREEVHDQVAAAAEQRLAAWGYLPA